LWVHAAALADIARGEALCHGCEKFWSAAVPGGRFEQAMDGLRPRIAAGREA
jgi:hypothetical protein